jgi:hypothetical protein
MDGSGLLGQDWLRTAACAAIDVSQTCCFRKVGSHTRRTGLPRSEHVRRRCRVVHVAAMVSECSPPQRGKWSSLGVALSETRPIVPRITLNHLPRLAHVLCTASSALARKVFACRAYRYRSSSSQMEAGEAGWGPTPRQRANIDRCMRRAVHCSALTMPYYVSGCFGRHGLLMTAVLPARI